MKKFMMMLLVAGMAMTVMAVPAKRGGVTRVDADGTEKQVFLYGDESFHYMTDAEGNWLDEETLLPLSEELKNEKLVLKNDENKRMKVRRAPQETGVDHLLSPRGAVILVSYSDLDFESTKEDMEDWAMGENYTYNGATGSIHQYFLDQSWGEYDLQLDIFGPVKVSKKMAYYGANDSQGNDKHPDELVKEACILAHDSCGADFSQYDFDNDGYVDWVVIIYAGYGESSGAGANTIWPHQYELSYTYSTFKLDGKKVDRYCCLNEKEYTTKARDGIGTFCHEFSHVMGLPDLYSTNSDMTLHTLSSWDIMDAGSYNNTGNTPPNYSAYERWFMGWTTPRILTDPENVKLKPLQDSKECLLMCDSDVHNLDGVNPQPRTFYLLETRVKEGWDAYLPGRGMLITKIQYSPSRWKTNQVNNSESQMGVDIMEAKANTSYRAKSTDAFPAGADAFTKFEGHEITNIKRNTTNGNITFKYRGGTEGVESILYSEDSVQKILLDGQILIIRNNKLYDLNGRLVHENNQL